MLGLNGVSARGIVCFCCVCVCGAFVGVAVGGELSVWAWCFVCCFWFGFAIAVVRQSVVYGSSVVLAGRRIVNRHIAVFSVDRLCVS